MTKDEFYEEINDFDELIDFCERNGCEHIIEGIMRRDDFDDWVWDQIEELRSHWFWNELRDTLSDLESPWTDYFKETDGTFGYTELNDSDLDEYKDNVLDWGDEEGFWDEDDEEDDDLVEEEQEPEPEEEVFESSIDITCLIGVA